MNFKNLIREEHCIFLNSKTKTEAILELLELGKENIGLKYFEDLKKEIFYREQLMSTGIGQNIAIPHVRFEGIKSPLIIVGLSPTGIHDYESIDGQTVKIIVMILVGEAQHKEYLRILSLVVGKLKNISFQSLLLGAEDNAKISQILIEEKN